MSSEGAYGEMILRHVAAQCKEPKTRNHLWQLLKLTTPELAAEHELDDKKRKEAIKQVQLRTHPDKHANSDLATQTFQALKNYLKDCDDWVRTAGTGITSLGSVRKSAESELPAIFDYKIAWPSSVVIPGTARSADVYDATFKMWFNMRGRMLHGKTTRFGWMSPYPSVGTTIRERACSYFNTTKLSESGASAISIKKSICLGVPVIAEWCGFDPSYAASMQLSQKIDLNAVSPGESYPVLITGWRQDYSGESWIIASVGTYGEDIHLARGQFGLEVTAFALEYHFNEIFFERGPYLQLIFDDDSWLQWASMTGKRLMSWLEDDLAAILETTGGDMLALSQVTFAIVNRKRKYQSRRARFTKLTITKGNELPVEFHIAFLSA